MEEFASSKKKIEETINEIINHLKEDSNQDLILAQKDYLDCFNIVSHFGNQDQYAEELFKSHNELAEKSMVVFFEKIKDLEGNEFIDSFITCTKKLNLIMNILCKIFSFLDFYYIKFKKLKNLNENLMDIYKKSFFDKLQTKLFTILKGILPEEEKNEEIHKKVEAIMNIIDTLDYVKPKLIKTKGEAVWKETSEEKNVDTKVDTKEDTKTYKKMWEEFKA